MSWIEIARGQAGLISRRQLIACGVSKAQVDQLLRSVRLEPTDASGVFRAAGAPHTPGSGLWLAVLSTRAPLSYLSAAPIWKVEVPSDGRVHVTSPARRRIHWPEGLCVHRVALRADAVTQRHGLPVTTRTETILDCLGWLPLGQARQLADRSKHQGWLAEHDIERRLKLQPGRWGNRQLKVLVPQFADRAAAESERQMHLLLRQHGIRGWVANHRVTIGGVRYEIDIAFPSKRLAIEIDGYDYHRRERFQRDRTKQNALTRAGWTVLRFTWADLQERPHEVVATVTQLLVG